MAHPGHVRELGSGLLQRGPGALARAAVDHRRTGLLADVLDPDCCDDAHQQQIGAARPGQIDAQRPGVRALLSGQVADQDAGKWRGTHCPDPTASAPAECVASPRGCPQGLPMCPAVTRRDDRRMLSDTAPRRPAHNAAQWRKRLRRELQRVGASKVSLYIDGPRGIARLRFPDHAGQFSMHAGEALRLLRSVPDGAGVQKTVNTIAGT